MSLLEERVVYKPFEYPKAFDYWLKQQQAHWLHTEVPMAQDVTDWKSNMKPVIKNQNSKPLHHIKHLKPSKIYCLLSDPSQKAQ